MGSMGGAGEAGEPAKKPFPVVPVAIAIAIVVLIAAIAPGDAAAALGRESADAVVLRGNGKGAAIDREVVSALDLPWGVSLDEVNAETLLQLKEMGCDFLVFDAERAPAALLGDKEMGKVVEVAPSLADGLIRAVGQMAIDALLLGIDGDPSLSVYRLMVCHHVATLACKPLLAVAPPGMSKEDLEWLQEAGVAGVVVNVEGSASEELSRLRQAIAALPPSRRKGGKGDVLLPYAGGVTAAEMDDVDE